MVRFEAQVFGAELSFLHFGAAKALESQEKPFKVIQIHKGTKTNKKEGNAAHRAQSDKKQRERKRPTKSSSCVDLAIRSQKPKNVEFKRLEQSQQQQQARILVKKAPNRAPESSKNFQNLGRLSSMESSQEDELEAIEEVQQEESIDVTKF